MPQGQSYPTTFLRSDNSYQDPISNNLSTNNPSYPYSSIFTALLAAIGFNVRTKAATDYYVGTDGNDANTGLVNSAGGAWRTLAHAMAVILSLDFAGQTVTLHVRAGHAAYTEQLKVTPWVGGGAFIFDGGGGSITYAGVLANNNGFDAAILVSGGSLGSFTYQNVTLSTTLGTSLACSGVLCNVPALVTQGPGVVYGACEFAKIYLAGPVFFSLVNSFSESGNAQAFLAVSQGFLSTFGKSITATWTQDVTYGVATVWMNGPSLAYLGGINWNPTGKTITGYKDDVSAAGVLNGGGSSANIPGSGSNVASPGVVVG
jgi:hypothetical protein